MGIDDLITSFTAVAIAVVIVILIIMFIITFYRVEYKRAFWRRHKAMGYRESEIIWYWMHRNDTKHE